MSHVKYHSCQLTKIRNIIRPNIWQKVIHKFREITSISPKHPYTSLLFRSSYTIKKEQKRHSIRANWCSIHPYSMFNFTWRIIMMFTNFMVVTLDVYHVAVVRNEFVSNSHNTLHEWDSDITYIIGAFNLLCVIDIGFNFITGYVETSTTQNIYSSGIQATKSRQVVLNKSKIAIRYFKQYFFVDMVAIENMVGVLIYASFKSGSSFLTGDYIMMVLRLFRFIRFISVMTTLRMVIDRLTQSELAYEIAICGFLIVYSVFIFGCMHLAIPEIDSHFSGNEKINNIPERTRRIYLEVGRTITDWQLLARAMYLSLCIISGTPSSAWNDYGTIAHSISLLTMFVGYSLRTWFLLLIITSLHTKYKSWIIYKCFYSSILKYMHQSHLNHDTQHRILVYLEQTLKLEKFRESDILNAFEKRLKYEIFTKTSMGLIRKCHLFRNLPSIVISSLAFSLKYETYVPGQQIMKVGEYASCMYFIASGSVAVYNRFGEEVTHLSDGDYVGEIGLLYARSGRTASIITIEETKMYRLDIKDFQEIIKPNSKLHNKLRRSSTMRTLKKSYTSDT